MQELQKQRLSQEQCKLITDNYEELKKSISIKLNSASKKIKDFGRQFRSIEETISYIPDVTLNWNPSKSKTMTYVNYVASLCVMRRIDEYRKMYRNEKHIKKSNELIEKVKRELFAENGIDNPNEDEIIEGLAKYVKDPNRVIRESKSRTNNILNSISPILFNRVTQPSDFNEIKESIIEYAKDYLKDNKQKSMYMSIIEEYIFPKVEKKFYLNRKQIAEKFGVSESKIFSALKSDKMKRIFGKYLNTKRFNIDEN